MTNRRTKLELSEYVPYLVNRVGTALAIRFTEDALARHDLSVSMWRVLAVLAQEGTHRQIDVVDQTSIDASTLSRLVTRLVRMGLVTRARSVRSNREVTVALTAKARRLMQELVPVAHSLEQTTTAGLSADEIETAKRLFRRMYGNLVGAPGGTKTKTETESKSSTLNDQRRSSPRKRRPKPGYPLARV